MNYVLEILLIVLVGGLLFGGAHLLKDRLGLLGIFLTTLGGAAVIFALFATTPNAPRWPWILVGGMLVMTLVKQYREYRTASSD